MSWRSFALSWPLHIKDSTSKFIRQFSAAVKQVPKLGTDFSFVIDCIKKAVTALEKSVYSSKSWKLIQEFPSYSYDS